MGREWYWGGKSSKRGGAGGEKDTSSSGCMNAVFQFFDFHHFQFALHHQEPSFDSTFILPEEPTIPKGSLSLSLSLSLSHTHTHTHTHTFLNFDLWVSCNSGAEAPRNSLQSEELLLSHIIRERVEEKTLHIPVSYSVKNLFYNLIFL